VLLITALSAHGVYPSFLESLRHAAFNVVSVATTTGYATVDYAQWPLFAPLLMLLLGCFATCAGSTGGGIKMVRMLLLLKQARASWCASCTRARSTRWCWAARRWCDRR
jgi:trk system potassium uptake protein TrkH